MTVYLNVDQIIFLHRKLIERFGGAYGIRDMGLLESSVARPQATFGGKDLYPDMYGKASALCHSLLINHPFLDGKKRTAFAAMDIFLQENGYIISADDGPCEEALFNIIEKTWDDSTLSEWLRLNTKRHKHR
jgi:death on curing protein